MTLRRQMSALGLVVTSVLAGSIAGAQPPSRPQTPVAPWPYAEEAVTLRSASDGATLAGTLTRPSDSRLHPALLLLSVAGPNDRDLSFAGHRAFAVLADRLTRDGFVVLRMDDRGVGESQGSWADASYDLMAADGAQAIAHLRNHRAVDPAQVGVLGLSEGAVIAAMVAARMERPLAFAVFASPPGLPGQSALSAQFDRMLALSGIHAPRADTLRSQMSRFLALARAAARDSLQIRPLTEFLAGPGRLLVPPYAFMPRDPAAQARIFAGAWYQSQLDVEPARFYAAVRAPMLVIGGGSDVVLPPGEHHPPIRTAAPGAEFRVIPGASHLLQPATTGAPDEYARTEITIDPRALDAILAWLRQSAR